MRHRVEVFQHAFEIADGGVHHVGQILKKILVFQELLHPVQHVHQGLRILTTHVWLPTRAPFTDLVLQAVSQLLVTLISLLHFLVHFVHAIGVFAGHALHKVAHLLVVGLELLGQTIQFISESLLLLWGELERIGRILVEQFAPFLLRFAQKIAHTFD